MKEAAGSGDPRKEEVGRIRDTAGFLLARTCRAHRARVGEALSEVGLHAGQEMVLLQLWEEDGLSPSELAGRLRVEPPTVTNMLSRLEKAGLLKRKRSEKDARCTLVYLTDKGRSLREPVEERWAAVERRAFAGLSPEEERALRRALSKAHDNLGGGSGAGPCGRDPDAVPSGPT